MEDAEKKKDFSSKCIDNVHFFDGLLVSYNLSASIRVLCVSATVTGLCSVANFYPAIAGGY
jgi:hypothetical protein